MILVFGKTGQVAQELQRCAPDAIYLGRDMADFANPDQTAKHVREIKPKVVINAAAYTAVDKAESDPLLAETVNGETPTAIAHACKAVGAALVHISTDYVFDGTGSQPRHPDDPTGPLGVYGASKLMGEVGIRASGTRHVILRTSWVFSAHGNNFVRTMLRLGTERDALSIVNDQIGGPTPASAIAEACHKVAGALADGHNGGTYHFSGTPDVSWRDFAEEIFRQANLDVAVTGIPTTDYPTPAARPLNSRLDCESLFKDFGIRRPDWKAALSDVLKELNAL